METVTLLCARLSGKHVQPHQLRGGLDCPGEINKH